MSLREYYKDPTSQVGIVLNVSTGNTQNNTPFSEVNPPGFVDVVSDVDCFYKVVEKSEPDPVAVVDISYKLVAGTPYRFSWRPGSKVAAITASGTGKVHIHPMK